MNVAMLSTGFSDAPVTRSLVYGVIVTSLLASITDSKHFFYIQADPHLLRYHQLWRMLSYQLCYTNSTEVFFGAITYYNMRVVERLWGSRRFAVSCSFFNLPWIVAENILLVFPDIIFLLHIDNIASLTDPSATSFPLRDKLSARRTNGSYICYPSPISCRYSASIQIQSCSYICTYDRGEFRGRYILG